MTSELSVRVISHPALGAADWPSLAIALGGIGADVLDFRTLTGADPEGGQP